ncbi:MAG TPA: DNA repair protein RecN [Ohtaekwangia sp.]|nr:DNA repair protein RecN [Ohtaekwangia sp.]
MLTHLTIKNYALIKHLELEPSAHLNVVTGETGAGKSIMLGAIGLLMGNRADTKVLWDEQEKCVTEGVFAIGNYKLKGLFKAEDLDYDDNTVIRREISPGGKSRAFINDTPVTLEVMKKIGSLLMDIHSQHETLQLASQSFQLKLIDTYAGNSSLVEDYNALWTAFQKAKADYEKLVTEAETLRQESDYIAFQLEELVKVNLEDGEQEKLETELNVMEHAGEIKTRFHQALGALSTSEFPARQGLKEARQHLNAIVQYAPQYESILARLEAAIIELDDVINEMEREESAVEFDPERAAVVNERLSTLYNLLKKHKRGSVRELLDLQEALTEKNNITSNLDEALAKFKTAFDEAERKVRSAAARLSEARQKAFSPLCKQLIKLLRELGIPETNLQIESRLTAPSPTGIDRIEILFSANKGIAPKALSQVASGGEFSRVMFCIKYVMAEKTAMPTLVLDEIDSGISGEVSMKLGAMMKTMAERHQLITITHLPQIAARGDVHYFVYKDNTAAKTMSTIRQLTAEERVEEIAKMIGGAKPSKVARENAQELLTK